MTDEEFYIDSRHKRESDPFFYADLMEETRKFFRAYIWAKKSCERKKARVGWCSNCGEFIDEELMERICKGKKAKGTWHNACVDCPHCGRSVTVIEESRMRSYNTLWQSGLVAYIYAASPELVYIRVFDIYADYSDTSEAIPEFKPYFKNESARYRLRPGEFVSEKYECGWHEDGSYSATKAPYEPAVGEICGICGADRLCGTFLKYHQLGEYYSNCNETTRINGYYYKDIPEYRPLRYLCYYAMYPQLEMVAKLGIHWAVNGLVNGRVKNARDLNWKAKTPYDFLKLDKLTAKEFLQSEKSLDVLKLLHAVKCKMSVADCREIHKSFGDRADEAAKKILKYSISMGQVRKYVDRNKITVSDWIDYLEGAETLQYDLSVHNVIFPKHFAEAHDGVLGAISIAKFNTLPATKKKALKRRAAKYEWQYGEWIFKFPLCINDIVREGKALSHCVGGYANRHINGKTNIIFMRLASAPDTSQYTIEVQGENVRQAYGMKNRIKPQEDPMARRAFEMWKKHIAGKYHTARLVGDIKSAARTVHRATAMCAG